MLNPTNMTDSNGGFLSYLLLSNSLFYCHVHDRTDCYLVKSSQETRLGE